MKRRAVGGGSADAIRSRRAGCASAGPGERLVVRDERDDGAVLRSSSTAREVDGCDASRWTLSSSNNRGECSSARATRWANRAVVERADRRTRRSRSAERSASRASAVRAVQRGEEPGSRVRWSDRPSPRAPRARARRSPALRRACRWMEPRVGRTSSASRPSSVDLPLPLGPSSTVTRPGESVRSTPASARVGP